jgi:hypothetical protein
VVVVLPVPSAFLGGSNGPPRPSPNRCYKSVTAILQECYKSVIRMMLQRCYKDVTRVTS